MKFKGTVAAFADYVQYSPTLWYRGFYNTVYSRAISTNRRRHCLNLTTTVSQDPRLINYLGFQVTKVFFVQEWTLLVVYIYVSSNFVAKIHINHLKFQAEVFYIIEKIICVMVNCDVLVCEAKGNASSLSISTICYHYLQYGIFQDYINNSEYT